MFNDFIPYLIANWQIPAFFVAFGVVRGMQALLKEKLLDLVVTQPEVSEQEIWAAAHMVHETRRAVEQFFARNPDENFSSFRGKEMLVHHTKKYEEYLRAIGVMPDSLGVYHDTYWAQLKKLESHMNGLRVLPGLPGMVAHNGKHRALSISK